MKSVFILSVGLWANVLIALWAGWGTSRAVDFWQVMTRLSGRVSLGIFVCIMVYETCLLTRRALPAFLQNTQLWHWTTGFALHHFWHLLCIAVYVQMSGVELVPIRLAGGTFAYLLVGVVPFLHYRHLELRWKRPVRFLYLYWVWFVMFMTYVARLKGDFPHAGGAFQEYVAFMAVAVVLLLWHFSQFLWRGRALSETGQ